MRALGHRATGPPGRFVAHVPTWPHPPRCAAASISWRAHPTPDPGSLVRGRALRLQGRLHPGPRGPGLRDQPGDLHEGQGHRVERADEHGRSGGRLRGRPGLARRSPHRPRDGDRLRHADRNRRHGGIHGDRGERGRQHHRNPLRHGERRPADLPHLRDEPGDLCPGDPGRAEPADPRGRVGDVLLGEPGAAGWSLPRSLDGNPLRHPVRGRRHGELHRDGDQLGGQHDRRARHPGQRRAAVGARLRDQPGHVPQGSSHRAQPALEHRRCGGRLRGDPCLAGRHHAPPDDRSPLGNPHRTCRPGRVHRRRDQRLRLHPGFSRPRRRRAWGGVARRHPVGG